MSNSEPKTIILIDMDGVVADFDATLLEIYKTRYPNDFCIELQDRVGLYGDQQYDQVLGQKYGDRYRQIMAENGFFYQLQPLEPAIRAIKNLMNDPVRNKIFKIMFCTSPLIWNKTCASDKLAWIEKYFGHRMMKNVMISSDKTLVHGNLLIDDKPKIKGILGDQPKFQNHVLMRCWHNSRVDASGYQYVLEQDWSNFYEIIDRIRALQLENLSSRL